MEQPPAATIEAWFTGADGEALERLAGHLADAGATVSSAPWSPFTAADPVMPPLPWSMVLAVPAGIDPTVVAAAAEKFGCVYHPGGGSDRWQPSPVTLRR